MRMLPLHCGEACRARVARDFESLLELFDFLLSRGHAHADVVGALVSRSTRRCCLDANTEEARRVLEEVDEVLHRA